MSNIQSYIDARQNQNSNKTNFDAKEARATSNRK